MTGVVSTRAASRSLKLTKPPPLKSQVSIDSISKTSVGDTSHSVEKTSPVFITEADKQVKKTKQTELQSKDTHGVLSLSEDWQKTQESKIGFLVTRISANHHSPLEVLTLCENLKEYGYLLEAACKESLDKWFCTIRELVLKETYPKHSKIHLLSILEHRARKWNSDGKHIPTPVKTVNKTTSVQTQTVKEPKPKEVQRSSFSTQTFIDNTDYESGCLNTDDGMLYIVGETPELVNKVLKIVKDELTEQKTSKQYKRARLSVSDKESLDGEFRDVSSTQTPSEASDSGFNEQQYAWELLDKMKSLTVCGSNRIEDVSDMVESHSRRDDFEISKSRHVSGYSNSEKRDSFSSIEEEGPVFRRSNSTLNENNSQSLDAEDKAVKSHEQSCIDSKPSFSLGSRTDRNRSFSGNDKNETPRHFSFQHRERRGSNTSLSSPDQDNDTNHKRSFDFGSTSKPLQERTFSFSNDKTETPKHASFLQRERRSSNTSLSSPDQDNDTSHRRGFDFGSTSKPSHERSFSFSNSENRNGFGFSVQGRSRHSSMQHNTSDSSLGRYGVNRRQHGGFNGLRKSDSSESTPRHSPLKRSLSENSQVFVDFQTMKETFKSDVNRNRFPSSATRVLKFPSDDIIPRDGTVIRVREPISPFTTKREINLVESCMTGGQYSAKARRRMFDKFSEASTSFIDDDPEGIDVVLTYTRNELLEYSSCETAHLPPEQFSFLSKLFPQICHLKVSEYFDHDEFNAFWKEFNDDMKMFH